MYHDSTLQMPPAGRLAQFARIIKQMERVEVEAAVIALIARLDADDGDCDLEPEQDTGVDDFGEAGTSPEPKDCLDWNNGLSFEDDEAEGDHIDQAIMRPHCDYIRRNRCDRVSRWGLVEYRLRETAGAA
jgi:hypothetical protein